MHLQQAGIFLDSYIGDTYLLLASSCDILSEVLDVTDGTLRFLHQQDHTILYIIHHVRVAIQLFRVIGRDRSIIWVTGNILKFADDTKLFRKVKEIGDKQKLQDDIDKLVKWSEKWQMLFNFGECKCLHTGSGNTGVNYEMGGTILSKTVKEKDLGVTMNANMKVSEQCRIAASKGNHVLGMIRRNITYKEKSLIIPLYKAIVRPHLEYCIQAWNPYLRKDVDMLEKIQRTATKLIPGLRDLT